MTVKTDPTQADLTRAVDALTEPTHIRVPHDTDTNPRWRTIPSIWDQLTASTSYRGGGDGNSAFGSRPVIATGIVSLIIDITQAAGEAYREHPGDPITDTPARLRRIAANTTDIDQILWWTTEVRRWKRDATSLLNLEPSRPRAARGATCPACKATHVTAPDEDGGNVRHPALAIDWAGPDDDHTHHPDTDWKVRAVECRACQQVWWRGPDLDGLVSAMLTANQTQETMTDGVTNG